MPTYSAEVNVTVKYTAYFDDIVAADEIEAQHLATLKAEEIPGDVIMDGDVEYDIDIEQEEDDDEEEGEE